MSEKGAIGLKEVGFFVLDDTTDIVSGTPDWGAFVPLAAAGKLTFDPGASQANYFAGDGVFQTESQNGLGKLGLECLDVIPASLAVLLGKTKALGQVLHTTSDSPVNVALAGKVTLSGGVYEYVVFYKVKFQDPKNDWQSKSDTAKFGPITLEGTGQALVSLGYTGLRQRSDDTDGDAAALAAWFTTVQLPGANLNAMAVVAARSSGNITFTFSKTGGGSFTLVDASLIAANLRVLVAGAVRAGSFSLPSGAGTTRVVTYTPTVAITGTEVTVVVESGVRDTNGVHVTTPYSVALTFP